MDFGPKEYTSQIEVTHLKEVTRHARFDGSRTFVRTDICSNRRKVEQMSVRTNILQLFWQFFKVLIEAIGP